MPEQIANSSGKNWVIFLIFCIQSDIDWGYESTLLFLLSVVKYVQGMPKLFQNNKLLVPLERGKWLSPVSQESETSMRPTIGYG